MIFVALPVRNLARHRVRSILTSLGISIAVGGMIALVGLSQGLERSWIVSLQGKGTHIVAAQKGSIDLLAASLDEKLVGHVAEHPGVSAALGVLGELAELDSGQVAFLAGRSLDTDFWTTLNLVAGAVPTSADPEGVVLGQALAQQLSKRPGDTIELSGRDFRIVGVSKEASVIDDRSVMMVLPVMQHLLGREGKISSIHIRVRHPEDAASLKQIVSRLSAEFPELSFTESTEIGENTQITRMMRAMTWASSTVALGMAFVAIMNTLLMSVMERTREIGLLCAIGWHSARVMTMIVLDGLILCAVGAAGGIAVGLACLRWISAHPKLGAFFQPEVTTSVILQGVGMALLIGLLGGLYPAWRATRLNPMDLLRGE